MLEDGTASGGREQGLPHRSVDTQKDLVTTVSEAGRPVALESGLDKSIYGIECSWMLDSIIGFQNEKEIAEEEEKTIEEVRRLFYTYKVPGHIARQRESTFIRRYGRKKRSTEGGKTHNTRYEG